MDNTNSRTFRTKLSEFFDMASKKPVAITRGDDRFVLMNEEEYLNLKDEFLSILRNLISMLEIRGGKSESITDAFHKQLNGKYVFVEKNGEEVKYAHVYRRFHQAQDRAGVTNKIRFHDLRHSFASNYMMNGGNVFDLQKLLGHTKIDMTMRYAHFSPNHLQGSLRFMNMYEGESSVVQEFIPVLDLEEKKVLDNLRIITG